MTSATAKAFHSFHLPMTHRLRPPPQTRAAPCPLVLSENGKPDSPRSGPKPVPSPRVVPICMCGIEHGRSRGITLAPASPSCCFQSSGMSIRPHGWKPARSNHLRSKDNGGQLEPERAPPSFWPPHLTLAEPASPVGPLGHHLQTL